MLFAMRPLKIKPSWDESGLLHDGLSSRESYPDNARIDGNETLVSLNTLASDTAIKVNERIELSNPGISTPEVRQCIAERESDLNSTAAPTIYPVMVPQRQL
ncbi:MAG: hypothetical protein KDA46_06905 [Parvularculaceae bacterium]|nr:hypothetical protein [Parvularculaceae bacterium]